MQRLQTAIINRRTLVRHTTQTYGRTMKRYIAPWLAGLCLLTSCATGPQQQLQTEDKRECAQNFTFDGSALGGRTFRTHQVIPNVSKIAAVERAAKFIVTDGWAITGIDKELGIISASATVSYGQGKTAPLSIGIDSVETGVEVSITFSISGGVSSPVNAVKDDFCSIMEAIAK